MRRQGSDGDRSKSRPFAYETGRLLAMGSFAGHPGPRPNLQGRAVRQGPRGVAHTLGLSALTLMPLIGRLTAFGCLADGLARKRHGRRQFVLSHNFAGPGPVKHTHSLVMPP